MAAPARDPEVTGRRDAALVAVLYAAGLRRTELVSLERDDWDAAERGLTVWGKGNKERSKPRHGVPDTYLHWEVAERRGE